MATIKEQYEVLEKNSEANTAILRLKNNPFEGVEYYYAYVLPGEPDKDTGELPVSFVYEITEDNGKNAEHNVQFEDILAEVLYDIVVEGAEKLAGRNDSESHDE